MAVELSLARPRARVVTPHVVERTATVNAHEKIAGSTLITVEQFGLFIWWGDAHATRGFQPQLEQFLARPLRPGCRFASDASVLSSLLLHQLRQDRGIRRGLG